MTRTHYETLGVAETASQAEIKGVYRRYARSYHPDRNKSKVDEEKFKDITAAYYVIGDPGRRQVYDYGLRQSRKAATAAGSSAGASSTPPPPRSSGSSAGAGGQSGAPPRSSNRKRQQASPPPPPPAPSAQGAYRYLFFLRGVLVGGAAAGAILILALVFYVACHVSSAATVNGAPPGPVSVAKTEERATPAPTPITREPTPANPEPTPVTPEPTPTRPEPTAVTPEPTLTPEPTPPEPEPSTVPPPVHLCGKWRGSFDWLGKEVRFTMRLTQRGNDISGTWTETHGGRLWRATIRGSVAGTTVTLVKTYVDTDSNVSFVSSDSSSELLRGTWETPQNSGSWQAEWVSELAEKAESEHDDSWRHRTAPQYRVHSDEPCWRRTPDESRVPCEAAFPRRRSSAP